MNEVKPLTAEEIQHLERLVQPEDGSPVDKVLFSAGQLARLLGEVRQYRAAQPLQGQAGGGEFCEVCGVKDNLVFRCRACADRATEAEGQLHLEEALAEMAELRAAKAEAELEPYKAELLKLAEELGEGDDPFAAWESLELLKDRATKAEAELGRVTRERDILVKLHESLIATAGMSRDTHETFSEWMRLTKDAGERLFALAGRESILLDALSDHKSTEAKLAAADDQVSGALTTSGGTRGLNPADLDGSGEPSSGVVRSPEDGGRFDSSQPRHPSPEGELRDKARLDYLETMVVNVRTPLPHGSADLFWASPDDSWEGEVGLSDIRAKIDAALAKLKDQNNG